MNVVHHDFHSIFSVVCVSGDVSNCMKMEENVTVIERHWQPIKSIKMHCFLPLRQVLEGRMEISRSEVQMKKSWLEVKH